ncbi:MAG: Flp pilus assembly protein CpaB [Pseudomonadota bacterium]
MRANSLRLVAALLILIGVGVGLFGYLQATAPEPVQVTGTTDQPSEPELERVVIAAGELPAGRELEAGDLTVASRYRRDLAGLEGRYTRPAELFGRKTVARIPEGEVVTADLLESPADGTPIGRSVSAGHKAIALAVDEVEAAGGFLAPGDMVDLVWFVDHRDTPGPYSRTLVRHVKVLAFGERIEPGPEDAVSGSEEQASEDADGDSEEKPRLGDRFAPADDAEEEGEERQPRARSVVLEIADEQISEVVLAARTGKIRLAVAGPVEPADEPIASVLAERDGDEATATAVSRDDSKESGEAAGDKGSADTESAEDESDGLLLEDLVDAEEKTESRSQRTAQQAAPPPRVRVFSGNEASTVEVAR